MDGHIGKREYRLRIQKEMERIRPEEIFSTQSYLNLQQAIARELTDGRFSNVYLYSDPDDVCMGWCDGRRVAINTGNALTGNFQTMAQQSTSLIGINGHECGHKNYTDLGLRKRYLDALSEGIWYPHPPEAENPQEEQALEQIKNFFAQKNRDALELVVQTAAYLHNILEDIYIENKMCARFPGSVSRGILLNRERIVEWIPTLRTLLEERQDNLTILMNLCCQYTLSGRINNWDKEENELLDVMRTLMPIIQDACAAEQGGARYLAVNQIVLKIWKYLYEIICEVETQRAEQGKEEKGDHSQNGQSGGNGAGNFDASDLDAKEPRGASSAMQEYLEHLIGNIPHLIEHDSENAGFWGFSGDEQGERNWKPKDPKHESDTAGAEEEHGTTEKQSSGNKDASDQKKENQVLLGKRLDVDEKTSEILWQMAKERVDAQINREINRDLQEELNNLAFDSGHRKVKKEICRQYQFTELQKEEYQKYLVQVKKVQRRLFSVFLPILQDQNARMERHLLMGKRIDMRSIADPQGAIYRKHYPGKKVNMAAVILIDTSDSMWGMRIEQAKLAALCLYDFCRKAGISVAVYGHHTDGMEHENLKDETVYLHCCTEFESDKNDGFRIAALSTSGANRDGVALRFVGEKLAKRTEKQKLLVVISDGMPNSNQYQGEKAKEDLSLIKKELTGRGIVFLAAAIGADKENIREIYQNAFLDISDAETLPVTLAKQFVKQIRRY